MKLVLMALRDEKVAEFMTPWWSQTPAAAVRSCQDMVNGRGGDGQESMPRLHPEDFRLYCLAEFETSSGVLRVAQQPELVAELSNLKLEG